MQYNIDTGYDEEIRLSPMDGHSDLYWKIVATFSNRKVGIELWSIPGVFKVMLF